LVGGPESVRRRALDRLGGADGSGRRGGAATVLRRAVTLSPTSTAGCRDTLWSVTAAERATVLVTGGSGFVGSHVVDALLRGGYAPRIFDLAPSQVHLDVETVVGDLADMPALERAMSGCVAVLHLAAAADVGEVESDPVEAERRNARCTLAVLEAARRTGVPRVVYASTVWVYSDVVAEQVDEDTPLCHPAHLYTATKLAGELYCRSYRELYGVESTVLRFGIPYGPRARPAAVIPRFVEKALAGEPLTVAGDGSQSRGFVYVEDLADGVVRALRPVAANRTYNLAPAEEVTILEIAEAVRDVVRPVAIERVPARAADFRGATVCAGRAEEELGWTAGTPLREGLRRYVEWRVDAEAPDPAVARRRLPVAAALGTFLLSAWVLAALAGLAVADLASDALGSGPLMWAAILLVPVAIAAVGPAIGRRACWGLAGAELAVAVLPWPGALARVGHAHQVLLLFAALVAVLAADAAGRGGLLRPAAERS
jgi:UDP-glucose 4-epimerase